MSRSAGWIWSTAPATGLLFRKAPQLHAMLYDVYKRFSEGAEIALIRRVVGRGDRVVDVGANIGFYTRLLAEQVGERGRVFSFEPDPTNFARLEARTRRYPQVDRHRAAIVERAGPVDLFLSPSLNVDHRTYESDEPRQRVTVDGIALDDFFASSGETVRLVKIDVQGAEHAAFAGMRELLIRSTDVHVLLELWPFVHDRFGSGTRALLEFLESCGLEVWRVEAGGRLGERVDSGRQIAGRDDPGLYFEVVAMRSASLLSPPDRDGRLSA